MLCTLNVIPASAEEAAEKTVVIDSTKKDCRYEGIGAKASGNGGSSGIELFPENDVFRPLWADSDVSPENDDNLKVE